MQQGGRNPSQPMDPRRMIQDQIVRDCYSKMIISDGRSLPECRYSTHLAIREYSQYPQQQPPSDIPPSQIGSVKNRILVMCTKVSGRVLLQKGKYNDQKHVYQIGRTWDLDELLAVKRVGTDGLILTLNKDYYWKSGEGPDRLIRFVHHIVSAYAKFTGRYPTLTNITIQELGLPSLAPPPPDVRLGDSRLDATKLRQRSVDQNAPRSMLVAEPNAALHYQNMDFTANGKLPLKPMVVMDVDRPGSKNNSQQSLATSSVFTEEPRDERSRANHPYLQMAPSAPSNDSLSFVFNPEEDTQTEHMPTISEYARTNGASSPLRNYKPEKNAPVESRKVSESLEASAARGMQLQNQLEGNETSDSLNFQPAAPKEAALSPEFGIEEAEMSEEEDQVPAKQEILEESTNIMTPNDSVIDDSIREIEDFMDSQLGFGKSNSLREMPAAETDAFDMPRLDTNSEPLGGLETRSSLARGNGSRSVYDTRSTFDDTKSNLEETKSNFSYDDKLRPVSMHSNIRDSRAGTPSTETGSWRRDDVKIEKDPEVEEMLEEMNWNVLDDSDTFIKKLTRELNTIKHKNVYEMTSLDFGKDTMSDEVKTSGAEVDNLVEIFKRMEVSFNLLAPQINEIENNSKGLQVKSINKKILYNDLGEILNKVRVNSKDLQVISSFNDFQYLELIPAIEEKLSVLYEALGAIGSNSSTDNLSNMQALKQYQERYENTAHSFIVNLDNFLKLHFRHTIDEITRDVATLFPRNLLVSFKPYLAYMGLTSFVKCVSEKDLRHINEKMNALLAQFLDVLLLARLKNINYAPANGMSSRLSQNLDTGLRKPRFGSTRLINKIAGPLEESGAKTAKAIESMGQKRAGEISDPKVILRMIHEGREVMLVIQYFIGTVFHFTNNTEYSEFVKENSFNARMRDFDDPDLDLINYKTGSNDLLQSMAAIFGNYINRLIRKLTPVELITPVLLVELRKMVTEASQKDQDFVGFSFLQKLTERYKNMWSKFISSQVDLLNKSDIRAKGGVLPAVKNVNQIVLATETSLQDTSSQRDSVSLGDVQKMVQSSYAELTRACVDLFNRDDPLLKSNSHDEKERSHRNVTIIQNVFVITQQLDEMGTANTAEMKKQLEEVLSTVEKKYFDVALHRQIGKIMDFVKVHTTDESKKHKKDDRILIRSLTSTHGARDLQPKVIELRRKLEKHFITADNMFEQDLLRKLWTDMEQEFAAVIQKFDQMVKSADREIDFHVTRTEIRRIFDAAQ